MPSIRAYFSAGIVMVAVFSGRGLAQSTATAPATVPGVGSRGGSEGIAKESIRSLGRDFFEALRAGDDRKVRELVHYTNPDSQAIGEAMFGLMAAEGGLQKTAMVVFGEDGQGLSLAMSEQEFADFSRQFSSVSNITITGNAADIRFDRAPSLMCILVGDKWKVDFDKTQALRGPLPPKGAIDSMRNQAAWLIALENELSPLQSKVRQLKDDIQTEIAKRKADPRLQPDAALIARSETLGTELEMRFSNAQARIEAIRKLDAKGATSQPAFPASAPASSTAPTTRGT